MKKLAVYGKGGIGKSTTISNAVSYTHLSMILVLDKKLESFL